MDYDNLYTLFAMVAAVGQLDLKLAPVAARR
jgi:hypothetical protein